MAKCGLKQILLLTLIHCLGYSGGFDRLTYDFHQAVIENNVPKVKELLKNGVDVNLRGDEGRTAFMYACWYSQAAVGDVLLAAGANPNLSDNHEWTAMDYAASRGHVGAVLFLINNVKMRDKRNNLNYAKLMYVASNNNHPEFLEQPNAHEYINRVSADGTTPLLNAIGNGFVDAVKKMVEMGADIHLRANRGYTALDLAAWYNQPEMITFFLAKGAPIDGEKGSKSLNPLMLAVQNKSVAAVRVLVQHGADTTLKTNDGLSIQTLAIQSGNVEIQQLLGRVKSASNHEEINRALLLAVQDIFQSDIGKAKELLEAGANPNCRGEGGKTPLHYAVNSGQPQLTSLLLKHGARPNERDDNRNTPLMFVDQYQNPTEENKLANAKLLVEAGADVNAVNENGDVAINFLLNLPKVVDYLVRHGVTLNKANETGRTPLTYAAESGNLEVVKILLRNGANPNFKQEHFGWSPLETAIYHKNDAIVDAMISASNTAAAGGSLLMAAGENNGNAIKKLLEKGVDINSKGKGGMTALMVAIDKGYVDLAQFLLASGAALDVGSLNGETPLCMASRKNLPELVEELLKHKVDVDAPCGAVFGAASVNSVQIVQMLAEAGADMTDRFTGHWKALFKAAENNNAAIAKILIDHGTPVDIRGNFEETALMVAAGKGSLDVIRLLVQRKADLEAESKIKGMRMCGTGLPPMGTPMVWAMANNQRDAAKLLLFLGAKPQRTRSVTRNNRP